jgi:hypothetical protein
MTVYGWAAVGIIAAIGAGVTLLFLILWAWVKFADHHNIPVALVLGAPMGLFLLAMAVFAANTGIRL